MKRGLALFAALCLALCLAGCGQTAAQERPPAATEAPRYYDAGTEAASRGDYAAAVDAFSLAIETDDDRARAYLGRGDSYLALAGNEREDGPGLRGLALRDYAFALELDPAVGGHVYDVYAALAEGALSAGHTDEALSYLRGAMTAASEEQTEQLRTQVKTLTDGILTASVWYMDAPDSRYYAFFPDGAGCVVDPVAMERTPLTYENEGFVLHIAGTGDWTYDPDRESYFTDVSAAPGEGGGLSLRLIETTPARMYGQWRAAILAAEADGRTHWTGEADAQAGYGTLYEKAYALVEALAEAGYLTEADAAGLDTARMYHDAAPESGIGLREKYEQIKQLLSVLPARLGRDGGAEDTVLDEVFPIGEDRLLDYFGLLTGWTLNAKRMAPPRGGNAFGLWETLDDVEHYFSAGRLYLCLPGYVARERDGAGAPVLLADAYGRFVIETPLYLGADVTASGEELASYLAGDSWVGLMDMGYSEEGFALELTLAGDMTCSDQGGYFPGDVSGRQSGQYTLDGRELTLTMAAEGYSAGTYRYEVLPMGESLYMTLMSDGILYGQTAGSAYVFCGKTYASGVSELLR